MVQALTKLLTFPEFILEYGNNPRYELADGELIDMDFVTLVILDIRENLQSNSSFS